MKANIHTNAFSFNSEKGQVVYFEMKKLFYTLFDLVLDIHVTPNQLIQFITYDVKGCIQVEKINEQESLTY